jgi:hypothetical protein
MINTFCELKDNNILKKFNKNFKLNKLYIKINHIMEIYKSIEFKKKYNNLKNLIKSFKLDKFYKKINSINDELDLNNYFLKKSNKFLKLDILNNKIYSFTEVK